MPLASPATTSLCSKINPFLCSDKTTRLPLNLPFFQTLAFLPGKAFTAAAAAAAQTLPAQDKGITYRFWKLMIPKVDLYTALLIRCAAVFEL
jgi:hypothetical protein